MDELLQSLIAQGMSEEEARAKIEEAQEIALAEEEAKKEKARALGAKLYTKLQARKQYRQAKENEWHAVDMMMAGRYTFTQLGEIPEGGSRVYMNICRPKTEAFIANLADILIQSSDSFFGIEATVRPELDQATRSNQPVEKTAEGADVTAKDMADSIIATAKERAENMYALVEDQFQECDYPREFRKCLDWGVRYGSFIMRGPTKAAAKRQSWEMIGEDKGQPVYALGEDKRAGKMEFVAVNPWHFYPDESATTLEQCEDTFETFFFNRKRLRALANSKVSDGFDREALATILETKPADLPQWYRTQRNETGPSSGADMSSLYEVWHWNGELDKDELHALGLDEQSLDALDDELDAFPAAVWGVGGTAFKVSLNPIETGDMPYSMCPLIEDPSSIFGHGIPWAGTNAQDGANAAWRMVNDNAGLSTGPQVIINHAAIRPADGKWQMVPRKTWWATNPEGADMPIDPRLTMTFVDIPMHMEELMQLVKMNIDLFDQEVNFSLVMQGSTSENTPDTAKGTTIAYNSGKVVLRRTAKLIDDNITIPNVQRAVDWNMQFSDDPNVKGDHSVVAKGSDVLMERQEQLSATANFAQIALNPQFKHLLDDERFIEQWAKNLRLHGVIRPKEEQTKMKEQMAKDAQAQQPPVDPARMKMADAAVHKAQVAEGQLRLNVQEHTDQMRLEQAWVQIEMQRTGLSEQEVQAKLAAHKITVDSQNQRFNTEAAIKMQKGSGF